MAPSARNGAFDVGGRQGGIKTIAPTQWNIPWQDITQRSDKRGTRRIVTDPVADAIGITHTLFPSQMAVEHTCLRREWRLVVGRIARKVVRHALETSPRFDPYTFFEDGLQDVRDPGEAAP